MHTLMDALGLDYRMAQDLKAAPDSLEMMAERLMADRLAQLVLDTAEEQGRRVTDREVLAVLKLWHFKKNEARQNVLPDGQKWVHSDTLGLVRSRTGAWCITSATQEYPHVTRVLNTWFKARLPAEMVKDFPCSSISLNSNYAAKRHRDGNNAGPSMIRGFGDYTGGELAYWPDDDRSGAVEDLPHKDRKMLNISKSLALFDGCRGHEVDPFKGTRFSAVWFNCGKFWTMGKENREFLTECGFTAQESQDVEHVTKLLPAPRGYPGCQSLNKMFGRADREQAADVYQWPEKVIASEEEQAEKLLSTLTAELDAFVCAKEVCDAAITAENKIDDNDGAEAKQEEKQGTLQAVFGRKTEPVPTSPQPTVRTGGADFSAEKRRAPSQKGLQGHVGEAPLKRPREEERATSNGISVDMLVKEDFKPEWVPNQELFQQGEFQALVRILEVGSVWALTNYFRLALHSSKDPSRELHAALELLSPSVRLPPTVVRRAIAAAFGCRVGPDDDLAKVVHSRQSERRVQGRSSSLTVSKVAEALRASIDGLARSQGQGDGLEKEEGQVVARLVEVLDMVSMKGRDAQVLIGIMHGEVPFSRFSVLQALAYAFALTRPPNCMLNMPAEPRTFGSAEGRQAYLTGMGKAVPLAFGEIGGSLQDILAALMEDTAPTRLLVRCAPSGGVPVLPMNGVQTNDMDEVSSRMVGLDTVVERRYAGKRVQIHRLGDCIAVFGNDQRDLGSSLGTEQLAALRAALVSKACVVDAIAVCSGESSSDVCFIAFDCLLSNGRMLTRQSLLKRHRALQNTITHCEFLQVAPQERFSIEEPPTKEDMTALLEDAKAAACPGLVFKSLSSIYEAGCTSEAWVTLTNVQAGI